MLLTTLPKMAMINGKNLQSLLSVSDAARSWGFPP